MAWLRSLLPLVEFATMTMGDDGQPVYGVLPAARVSALLKKGEEIRLAEEEEEKRKKEQRQRRRARERSSSRQQRQRHRLHQHHRDHSRITPHPPCWACAIPPASQSLFCCLHSLYAWLSRPQKPVKFP